MLGDWSALWPNLQARFAELPAYLGGHMLLSVTALAVGIAISIPLGLYAASSRRAQTVALGFASVVQTVPGLALLALMVPLLGGTIGFWPAFVALMLYSILPILRNTVTGLCEVDDAIIEAARGMGMTERQKLFQVQLPLALPVIIAGIRTATVWVVGTATLATPVGQNSLGNYIFFGLQTRNHVATVFGCVFAALLAIALDQLIQLLEKSVRERRRAPGYVAIVGLLLIVVGGLSPVAMPLFKSPSSRSVPTGGKASVGEPTAEPLGLVRIGSKPFTEQYILAEVLAQRLEAHGFEVDRKPNMGSTILFDALRSNAVDVYVDYSGTLWATVMKREETAGPEEVLIETAAHLKDEYGVISLGSLGFENAYCLAMHAPRAEELGVRTIGDLEPHAGQLSVGGDYEFFGRAEWASVVETYDLQFGETRGMDSTFMYGAVRDGQVDVIAAYSTDGRIAAYDLRVLEDPQQAFPPYDAMLLLSPQASDRREIVKALKRLINCIDDELMRRANMQVDVEGRSPAEAAAFVLDEALN